MIRRIRPLALVLVLFTAACSGDPTGVIVDPDAGVTARYLARWNATGIDDYRFTYSNVCYCVVTGTMQVTVRDGRVADVRQADGQFLPREQWYAIPTVDELFRMIGEAQRSDDYLAVMFHRSLGYPESAEIGTLDNDAGIRHLLSGLAPID